MSKHIRKLNIIHGKRKINVESVVIVVFASITNKKVIAENVMESICTHGKIKNLCVNCGGASICKHNIVRKSCKICNETGHLAKIVRSRVNSALKSNKIDHSIEYLGCTIEAYRSYLEKQFKKKT